MNLLISCVAFSSLKVLSYEEVEILNSLKFLSPINDLCSLHSLTCAASKHNSYKYHPIKQSVYHNYDYVIKDTHSMYSIFQVACTLDLQALIFK